jgi:hypothetical protein
MDPRSGEAVVQLYQTLQRYAGWLDRERASATVRTDVQALGAALDAGTDPRPLLLALENNLARLPGGELRKLLRAAAGKIRRAVEAQ